jgi:formylglycine-generating enzyme required for sulfatase activity
MIFVEGGTFTMGCTDGDCDTTLFGYEEEPAHLVKLNSFYIAKYPVTLKEWQLVMKTNPTSYSDGNIPVTMVSWDDVLAFIREVNRLTGKKYRLPTEAEWEYAARGGNLSKGYVYSGSNNIDEVAWYVGNSEGNLHPVGTKKPNELGIYDMSGNVWEWCSDWYDKYTDNFQENPAGPVAGAERVRRGGSVGNPATRCRVSARGSDPPNLRFRTLGFRLVHD